MSDLEIATAIACWAFVMALFGFFYGTIYASKQFAKLDKRISDLEANKVTIEDIKVTGNSSLGINCDSRYLPQRVMNIEVAIAAIKDAINKLARHTEYPKSKII